MTQRNKVNLEFASRDWEALQERCRSCSTHHFGPMLYHLARLVGAKVTAEVGIFEGYVTQCLALAMQGNGGVHYAIDKNEEYVQKAIKDAADLGVPLVGITVEDSATCDFDMMCDIIHIDGDHTYEGVKKDIAKFAPLVNPGGFIFFHDYSLIERGGHDYGVGQACDELLDLDTWEAITLPFNAGEMVWRRRA